MAIMSSIVRGALFGGSAIVAITSLAAGISTVRSGVPVDPYVWIENPLGTSTAGSATWHLVLATSIGVGCVVLLIRPKSDAGSRWIHWIVLPVLVLFVVLALKDAAVFYWLLANQRIDSSFPVPLSLGVSCLVIGMFWLHRASGVATRCFARFEIPIAMLSGTCGAGATVLMHLLTFGSTDYTRYADVAIVLGAKVYPDGTPSTSLADRLRTGIDLYQNGRVNYLLMTGATGVEGFNEALAMRDFAIEKGVPADRILVDDRGFNTRASARNCRPILDANGLSTALVVSHYYHLARCKLAFAEQRVSCTTVPARMSMRLVKEPYYVLRECVAYLVYSVERPFRASNGQSSDPQPRSSYGLAGGGEFQ
jgi:vancomycin permeability regulator SanA